MRLLGLVTIVAALAFSSAAGAGTAKPAVRIQSFAPLSVRGTHFKAREKVTVTVDGKWIGHTRANATGVFVLRFRSLTVDRCTGASVVAVGRRGSRAVAKHLPTPQCLPA